MELLEECVSDTLRDERTSSMLRGAYDPVIPFGLAAFRIGTYISN